LIREIKAQLKLENFKRTLESQYDFCSAAAFKVVDDWGYKYLDERNIKRFLRTMGHVATKQEIVAIIRRFDLDGDCKISLDEL
jgi:Ca2+-binding EF-hand superfamily protein